MCWYCHVDETIDEVPLDADPFIPDDLLHPYQFVGYVLDMLDSWKDAARENEDEDMVEDFRTTEEVFKRLFPARALVNLDKVERGLKRKSIENPKSRRKITQAVTK